MRKQNSEQPQTADDQDPMEEQVRAPSLLTARELQVPDPAKRGQPATDKEPPRGRRITADDDEDEEGRE